MSFRRVTTPPVGLVIAFGVALLVASCGRSAPEGASSPVAEDLNEAPIPAGVQVVSEDSVVPPSSTIAPSPTTTTTEAPTTAVTNPATTYVVQPGDTLSGIADQFGLSIEAISEANGITDVNSIRPGQELIIPAG